MLLGTTLVVLSGTGNWAISFYFYTTLGFVYGIKKFRKSAAAYKNKILLQTKCTAAGIYHATHGKRSLILNKD